MQVNSLQKKDKSFGISGVRVCLIFPPYRDSGDLIFLKTAKKDFGKIPPLSLCAVAAVLEKHDAVVEIIDANANNLSIEQVIDAVAEFAPDFLGFTLSTYQFHFTLDWIRSIKSRINVPVIVGGPHARIYSKQILSHRAIDYCICHDAEESLPCLLSALFTGKSLNGLPGIAFREPGQGQVVVNAGPAYIKSLDDVPFPSRHLLDNSLYYSLISKYKNFTAMTTTRGCSFQCTFCDNHCTPYLAMSPKRIVDEMEICNIDFGVNEIDMFDGVFSISKDRLLLICQEIRRRGLKVAWSFRTRVDLISPDLLKALRQAGCVRIYYGIESGSLEILKNIKKNVNLQKIKYAIDLTKREGIDTFGYFMIGNNGENQDTLKETSELMLSLNLDYVQIAPIFYPPNTEVYHDLVKEIKHDYWADYTINPDYKIEFPVIGTDYTKREIDDIVRKMYLRFYLRPKFIFSFLRKIKSTSEFLRSLKAISSMVKEAFLSYCKKLFLQHKQGYKDD